MTSYIDLPSEMDLAAKAAHIAVQRDVAIRIAHRLHKTCESLIYGLPKYFEQTDQTDEENMIGRAWHTFDAAAWQLAALPQPAATEPCFECGSTERIGSACAPCNPDLENSKSARERLLKLADRCETYQGLYIEEFVFHSAPELAADIRAALQQETQP